MGGWWLAATIFSLVAMSYAAVLWVLLHPQRLLQGVHSFLDLAALLTAALFLALAFAPTALRSAWRNRTLL